MGEEATEGDGGKCGRCSSGVRTDRGWGDRVIPISLFLYPGGGYGWELGAGEGRGGGKGDIGWGGWRDKSGRDKGLCVPIESDIIVAYGCVERRLINVSITCARV